METKNNETTEKTFVAISAETVQIHDTVFTENTPGATAYTVLDKGNPFILIENNETHFAYLYRAVKLYKLA